MHLHVAGRPELVIYMNWITWSSGQRCIGGQREENPTVFNSPLPIRWWHRDCGQRSGLTDLHISASHILTSFSAFSYEKAYKTTLSLTFTQQALKHARRYKKTAPAIRNANCKQPNEFARLALWLIASRVPSLAAAINWGWFPTSRCSPLSTVRSSALA